MEKKFKRIREFRYQLIDKFGEFEKGPMIWCVITTYYPSGYVKQMIEYNPDGSIANKAYYEEDQHVDDMMDFCSEVPNILDENGNWIKGISLDGEFIQEREIEYF